MLGIPFLSDSILKWFQPHSYDDPVDRLNYFITSTLLVFFALMVSAKQYVGAPIQCWVPMEFKGGWEQYAEDYCFIQNTYFLPFHKQIPEELDMRQGAEIGYYQWVPIVLAIQAIMFYIPNWIWKTLNRYSGLDLEMTIMDASKLRSVRAEERRSELVKLAGYIEECLDYDSMSQVPRRFFCFRFGRGLGSFVAMLYLFIKLLYLVNIIGQLFFLNHFLGSDYTFWGVQVMNDLMHGREWLESGVFPRVTLCDFAVRRLANIHRYTVQCVLMINMFNEKIYLFVWFWFLFVAVSTVINFMYCLVTLLPASFRERTTASFLRHTKHDDVTDGTDRRLIRRFAHNALRPDGILLLKFIEGHAGAIVARDLSAQLFSDFAERSLMVAPEIVRGDKGLNHSDGGSHTTKSTSPGADDGFSEQLYDPTNKLNGGMPLIASAPPHGYPGPPPPKPKMV